MVLFARVIANFQRRHPQIRNRHNSVYQDNLRRIYLLTDPCAANTVGLT